MPISSRQQRWFSRPLIAAITAALALSLIACNGMQSPVAPMGRMAPWLTNAQVALAGKVVNGMTLSHSQAAVASTFFRATLMGPDGPVTGAVLQVQYRVPHGPGMMSGQGLMTLHDDGTHGDPIARDGTYCPEDFDGGFGFHMSHAPYGQYHYEFFGIHDGEHTNHMEVAVTIASS